MPKPVASNDRSRRRGKAIAIEPERGLILRVLLHSPKDTFAGTLAFAGVMSIVVNALFLQAGRHPSPMFGTTINLPKFTQGSPSAAPPVQAAVSSVVPSPTVNPVPPTVSPLPKPRPAAAETRSGDPLGNLVRSTANMQRAPVPAPAPAAAPALSADQLANLIVSSQRVASVQRALTDYGYGQIKATGTVGTDTQSAIQKFEREHKMPITGLMSERLIRELSAATGRSFE